MKFIKSFGYAWQGIQYCFKTQLNFRVHILVLLLVTIAGFLLGINSIDWLFIISCTMLVLALEMLNTALEHLCNMITKEIHPVIKIAKDASAAAVLLAAAGSIIMGVIIFSPKIIHLLK